MLIGLYKPYAILSQFSPDGSANGTLVQCDLPQSVHPIGRLDADSEGLLLLTDEPGWENRLLHPSNGHGKTYWAQVEGLPDPEALRALRAGPIIQGQPTRRCLARMINEPAGLPERNPPVRFRKSVPTSWIEITLQEGRNRQVRRMTAAIGHPTLRIIRCAVGAHRIRHLEPGLWYPLNERERADVLSPAE
ncbi:MAG: pseudouridine synthase [Candidatus Methylacidiphilales bacterium]